MSPLGLAGLVFNCGCRLCVAVLCVGCGLGRDKLVDNGNKWLVLAERLVFYMNVAPVETFPQLLPYNVHELQHIESDTKDGGTAHDVEEDFLLCGFAYVTVHGVGTGTLAAAEQYGHPEATVQEVESEQGAHLEGCLEHQADGVGAEQTSINAPFVFVQFLLVFGLPMLSVGHMQGHQQGRGGHHNELQCPEAHLRDGKEMVEAGVLTAGLLGVAHKIFLLILPHLLGCRHVHQDPEEEDHREPDAADHCRILVDPTENVLQEAPVHLPLSMLSGNKPTEHSTADI